ncbi:hypothetical protein ACFP81_14565 [Deinococcus lacus]|uniref:Uncharacterized protein n=1 Tax=Deinococcus lacus TaxID=392561 RepID=A0ABW1YJQ2_9DEIO
MLKRREYPGRDGTQKTAHNLEVTIPEVGTGDIYLPEHKYTEFRALALSDGDQIELDLDANVFRGQINFGVASIRRSAVAAPAPVAAAVGRAG